MISAVVCKGYYEYTTALPQIFEFVLLSSHDRGMKLGSFGRAGSVYTRMFGKQGSFPMGCMLSISST